MSSKGLTAVSDYPNSMFSIFKKILSEEGVRGFYKGFGGYILAIMLWMSALPATTDFFMNLTPYLKHVAARRGEPSLPEQSTSNTN